LQSWIVPMQRATSAMLWAFLVAMPLFLAFVAVIAGAFAQDHTLRILSFVVAALLVGTAIGSVLLLFPMFAWAFRGGSRDWLDEVAEILGGIPSYPSIAWPTVTPHLNTDLDGIPTRIVLLRSGGFLGAYRPGERRLVFDWKCYVTIDQAAPAQVGVFPAGAKRYLGPRMSSLGAVPSADPASPWVVATDKPAVGARVAADPDAQEIAARMRAFPGVGLGATGRQAVWFGALRTGCTPAATAGMIRDLAALSGVVKRSASL
jgi:hypothetical protein